MQEQRTTSKHVKVMTPGGWRSCAKSVESSRRTENPLSINVLRNHLATCHKPPDCEDCATLEQQRRLQPTHLAQSNTPRDYNLPLKLTRPLYRTLLVQRFIATVPVLLRLRYKLFETDLHVLGKQTRCLEPARQPDIYKSFVREHDVSSSCGPGLRQTPCCSGIKA